MPDDYHAIASQAECIKGGAIGSMTFTLDHKEWQTKGWYCEEVEQPMLWTRRD